MLLVVGAVAVLDIGTGLYLLGSSTPWQAHGPATRWASAPEVAALSPAATGLLDSLYRRLGAFSLHAGVVTLVGAVLGARNRRLMGGLLVLWMVNGLAFFFTDRAAFAGTPYFAFKQIVGTAWALAAVWHFVGPVLAARRTGTARAGP
ncbi:MAG: hypothetical protein SFW67_04605 [Myxococcaceae bacterium]|nr:hypothetical protein [Myxococcaceae bacterium]